MTLREPQGGVTPTALDTSVAAKPRRWGAWYITEHKLRAMRAYKYTIVATAIGTPFIYLFAFGVGLATLVTENRGPEGVDGVSYLQFVAPALLCTAAVMTASEEFMFGILLGFKWNPIFYGMNAAPISGRQIIDGIFVFVAIRATTTVLVYYLVVLVFGGMRSPASWLTIPVAVLTALAFSLVAAYTATITEDRGQFNIVNRVILLPLTLFSGTVFPLEQLPVFLQWLGWLSPLWHGSELGRVFAYGSPEPIWLTVIHVLYLAALAIVGWQLCIRISERRLNR